jgi:hypothetical protein
MRIPCDEFHHPSNNNDRTDQAEGKEAPARRFALSARTQLGEVALVARRTERAAVPQFALHFLLAFVWAAIIDADIELGVAVGIYD